MAKKDLNSRQAIRIQLRQTLGNSDGKTKGLNSYIDKIASIFSRTDESAIELQDTTTRFHHAMPADEASIHSAAWSPDGRILALGTDDYVIRLWDAQTGKHRQIVKGHSAPVRSVAWSPDGLTLASGASDCTIRLWDAATCKLIHTLEGHSAPVTLVVWSSDGRLLATGAIDGSIRIWRSDTWETVHTLDESISSFFTLSLSFHNLEPILTAPDDKQVMVRTWELDTAALLSAASVVATVQYTSAKIVLVGESNVGKSCLALRLAQDQYEEQGTTMGMRTWALSPEQLSVDAIVPAGQKRDIVIWDMGGQAEYRLVHQLFLHDTTLALILLDPTRGQAVFNEVEEWNLRLEKQIHGRKTVKLLIGTKLDDNNEVINQAALSRLIEDCGFTGYYPTSAKTGRGIPELRAAIAKFLDWEMLAKTSRPILFQQIRDEIEGRQRKGEAVLLYSKIESQIRRKHLEQFDHKAVDAVVEQLALQGMITDTRLASGKRVLILQISEVERYAGSIIIEARNNPRGVPAIEEQTIASAKISFPGIKDEERINRAQERMVLECVVQLLLAHGICLKHEGLLIFPALFQPTEKGDSTDIPHSISLYYDFSGAINNIYSSLVALLAISEQFGRLRLWEDRAEFEQAGQGVCGLRKAGHRSGLAHLDLFFSNQTSNDMRKLFTVFIDEHLRKEGVRIIEVLEVTCVCGYRFQESSLRKRFAEGRSDIICPECETRSKISEGAKKTRTDNPEVELNLLALKTIIGKKSNDVLTAVKQIFKEAEHIEHINEPIRVLHLSDLHMRSEGEPKAKIQPLIRDLEDKKEGLGIDQLDYLVVSGDLTNRATAEEFEKAYQLISSLIDHFRLTAERCIIVPGNHDLSWDQLVYEWKQKRLVDMSSLKDGSYYQQGDILLIRNNNRYSARFENFTKFYHSLIQQQYPINVEQQCIPFLFNETKIQFMAMNSAWEIDEFFQSRSSINNIALEQGLEKAALQIKKAKEDGRLSDKASILRIAIWHHPITGNDKIIEDAFLDRLRQEEIQLCLHGHVHEDRADLIGYLHRTRRIHIAGAGSFGAPAYARPEAIPRLYNVLEIERDHSRIRVHTRCLRKGGGAWEGWAIWPGETPTERRTYYDIILLGNVKNPNL